MESSKTSHCHLLIIPNGEEWHYLAVKKLLALLTGLTSKNNGDFCCLNWIHFLRTKNKLESHKKVCRNKDFSREESLIEKTDGCKNNPENWSRTKVCDHSHLKAQKISMMHAEVKTAWKTYLNS